MRVLAANQLARSRVVDVEITALAITLERDVRVLLKSRGIGQVEPDAQIGVDVRRTRTISGTFLFRAIVETDDRYVDLGTVDHPFAIRPREKNVAGFLDGIENESILSASDPLRSEQSDPLGATGFKLGSCLREPITDEVGLSGHLALVDLEELFDIVVAQSAPQQLAPEEWGISNDELRGWPRSFGRIRFVLDENGVAVLDRLQRTQDRIALIAKAVGDHPLNLADPHRYTRQLRSIAVELDPEHDLRTDAGKLLAPSHRPRGPHDCFLFQVFHRAQRQIE